MAALPIELHPEALAEAREARLWYAQRSPTAALRFLNELDRAIEEIALYPSRWPTHLHGTRRYLLRRFPYLLVYRATARAGRSHRLPARVAATGVLARQADRSDLAEALAMTLTFDPKYNVAHIQLRPKRGKVRMVQASDGASGKGDITH